MKPGPIVSAVTCYCVLTGSAAAETCDQRYPGSCRLEVSTTIVKTKGEAETAAVAPRVSGRITRTRKPLAKGNRVSAATAAVPLPPPSPRRILAPVTVSSVPLPPPSRRRSAVPSGIKPTAVVDQAFNTLTASDWTNGALEAALLSRRDHMLGFNLR
jgi:hypothetical protein